MDVEAGHSQTNSPVAEEIAKTPLYQARVEQLGGFLTMTYYCWSVCSRGGAYPKIREFTSFINSTESYVHVDQRSSEARGLSVIPELLHRDFRTLAVRIGDCFLPTVQNLIGDEALIRVTANDKDRPPSEAAVETLKKTETFELPITPTDGSPMTIQLTNDPEIGYKKQCLLETVLGLRELGIEIETRPRPVERWIRDTCGLQGTSLETELRVLVFVREALASLDPSISLKDIRLDIPDENRVELVKEVFKQQNIYRLFRVIALLGSRAEAESDSRFTISNIASYVLGSVGLTVEGLELSTPAEAGTLPFFLGHSPQLTHISREEELPVSEQLPEVSRSSLVQLGLEIANSETNGEAANLLRGRQPLFREVSEWNKQRANPIAAIDEAVELLKTYAEAN